MIPAPQSVAVAVPADGAVPDLAPALAALAEVYVEYELTREVTVAASDDLPVGALLDGAEVRERR